MRAAEHANPPIHRPARLRSRSWWPHAKRALTFIFFTLIAWLLIEHARDIEWDEVGRAVRRLPAAVLLAAAALAALSFAIYTTFDLIGRHYTRHKLPTLRVMLVAFISYAFNLNLGSLVGAIAFRFRLYSKYGLPNDVITRVLGLSMLTNWLGCFTLAGVVLCFFTPRLPPQWAFETAMLPWLGGALLTLVGAYLLACAFLKRRDWRWRSHELTLPSARMALMQLAMSMLNWMIMASIIFTLLQARIDYPTVLVVLLMAAVAGVITHVPAGLGVVEAVFVAMLSSRLPSTQLLAGLLAYRAVYYLMPLAVAAILYACVEWRTHPSRR